VNWAMIGGRRKSVSSAVKIEGLVCKRYGTADVAMIRSRRLSMI